jgi:hypothetical protein
MTEEPAHPENWLLGGALTLFTTVLASLGAVQLGMDRMLRNHPLLVIEAFFLLILSAVLGGFALTSSSSSRTRFIRYGLVAFAIAGGLAIIAAAVTPGEKESPTISAQFKAEGRPTLNASVKVGGLRSREDVDIWIKGHLVNHGDDPSSWERLYSAKFGPDRAGGVDFSVKVPLTTAAYDLVTIAAWVNKPPDECGINIGKDTTGCAIVVIPRLANRPQLSATWEGKSSSTRALVIRLKARDMQTRQSVDTRVIVVGKSVEERRSLGRTISPPDSQGAIDSSFRVPIKGAINLICVAATVVSPDVPNQRHVSIRDCPTPDPSTVWTMLRVPT